MNSESKPVSPLDNIGVASPCHAKWSEMTGDERARFCLLCSKHVYNLSAMSRTEAEALILQKEGKLCVRFARRADGTVISDNCPVGLRRVRDRLRWLGAGLAAALAFVGSAVAAWTQPGSAVSVKSWFVENQREFIQGDCVFVPTTPNSSGTTAPATPGE